MLVANAIPLFGVLQLDWNAAAVVVLYVIETIIIGIFHAGRLLFIGNRGEKQEKTNLGTLPLTVFFLFHYNFFIFVQSVLLFGLLEGYNLGFTDSFNLVHNFGLFFKEPYLISIYAFIGSQLVYTGRELFVTHSYEHMGADRYMFLPYTRIFVQQFVVIIGAFFMIATNSPTTIVVLLILFKTLAEYMGQRYGEAWLKPKGMGKQSDINS